MKRKIFVASILALASAGMSVTAFGQDADPVLEAYAAAYDLTYEEARDRLILMDSGTLAELHDQLKRDPSFAGMDRPAFCRHPQAIIHGYSRGVHEQQAIHG